jgi:uncharacterized protein (UPF0332 family)
VFSSFGASCDEHRLSREELDAAQKLVESGLPRQAISRAYNAAFYAARAALEAIGERPPKTHSGMRSRFSDLARSTPAIGPDVGRSLSQLGTDRTEADYDEPTMTTEEANEAIDKARHVVDVIERAIAEGLGYEPPS